MINPALGYSDYTATLLARQRQIIGRRQFQVDQTAATACILRTYDLFELPRPQHIVWVIDPYDKQFRDVSTLFETSSLAEAARLIRKAGAGHAAAMHQLTPPSAWAAMMAAPPQIVRPGMVLEAAIDFDFFLYAYKFEYCQHPAVELPPNDYDYLYLEYGELLLQANEAGAGYRVEQDDTLFIAPMPLVRLDFQNRWHCVDGPAIRWEGGHELYYFHGRFLDKARWEEIVNQ